MRIEHEKGIIRKRKEGVKREGGAKSTSSDGGSKEGEQH